VQFEEARGAVISFTAKCAFGSFIDYEIHNGMSSGDDPAVVLMLW
jgi:hypothetical protein